MRDIGKNIRALRIQKGMTQEQFAEKLFVTRQTVSNYETGRSRPDIDMVVRIAQVLETDANTVLYGSPVPQSRKQELRTLFISGGIFLVLTVLVIFLYPPARELYRKFETAPIILLRLTLISAQMLFLGWTVMHGLWMLLDIKPLRKNWCGIVRKGLLILTAVGILLLLPYIVYLCVVNVWRIVDGGISMHFPAEWLYLQWLGFIFEHPAIAVVWGVLLRIFEIPKQKSK